MAQQNLNVGATPDDGTGDGLRDAMIKVQSNTTELFDFKGEKLVRIKEASDFGFIDSTIVYVIDGEVDMTGVSLEVPAGGLSIIGYTFRASKLICTDDNYTMFTSPVGGSGNILFKDLTLEVSGNNSKVYDLKSVTGAEACEYNNVYYNNCSSLGVMDNYRQGFEDGTSRFGGTPELELKGEWTGGYFINSSIVRNLVDGPYYLFKAGTAFTMASRFRSNQNIDLNATVGFFDFAPSNFVNSNILQLTECIITRNGVNDPSDTTITPNITHEDIASVWRNNSGIENTFIGGVLNVTNEVTTNISSSGVFVDLLGTYTANDLQHFEMSTNGQLKHIGSGARNYNLFVNAILDSNPSNEIDLKIVVWDNSASAFVDYKTTRRVVNNLQGGRDVAFFNFQTAIILDKDDYVFLQVANVNNSNNITAELGSEFRAEER